MIENLRHHLDENIQGHSKHHRLKVILVENQENSSLNHYWFQLRHFHGNGPAKKFIMH